MTQRRLRSPRDIPSVSARLSGHKVRSPVAEEAAASGVAQAAADMLDLFQGLARAVLDGQGRVARSGQVRVDTDAGPATLDYRVEIAVGLPLPGEAKPAPTAAVALPGPDEDRPAAAGDGKAGDGSATEAGV